MWCLPGQRKRVRLQRGSPSIIWSRGNSWWARPRRTEAWDNASIEGLWWMKERKKVEEKESWESWRKKTTQDQHQPHKNNKNLPNLILTLAALPSFLFSLQILIIPSLSFNLNQFRSSGLWKTQNFSFLKGKKKEWEFLFRKNFNFGKGNIHLVWRWLQITGDVAFFECNSQNFGSFWRDWAWSEFPRNKKEIQKSQSLICNFLK